MEEGPSPGSIVTISGAVGAILGLFEWLRRSVNSKIRDIQKEETIRREGFRDLYEIAHKNLEKIVDRASNTADESKEEVIKLSERQISLVDRIEKLEKNRDQ